MFFRLRGDPDARVRRLMEHAFGKAKGGGPPRPAPVFTSWSPYLPEPEVLDFEAWNKQFESGNSAVRIQILRYIRRDLWARPAEDIAAAVGWIQTAIDGEDETLQAVALDVFLTGGQVVQGIDSVISVLNRPARFTEFVLRRAIEATDALLAESDAVRQARHLMRKIFGSSDLEILYTKTSGRLDASLRESIEALLRGTSKLAWTARDRKKLGSALISIIDNEQLPADLRSSAARVHSAHWPRCQQALAGRGSTFSL